MSEKIYLHPIPERIWHWIHAILIIFLIISGIQIHWPGSFKVFGGYSNGISVHNWAGILLVCDFFLWLLYNLIDLQTHVTLYSKEGRYTSWHDCEGEILCL